MNEVRVRGNVWSVTAAVLVVAAVAALAVVLSDTSMFAESLIPSTLLAALLGGTAFFAGLALAERGSPLFGLGVAVASLLGSWSLVFAIWNEAITESQLDGLLWGGIVALVTAAGFATRLLATTALARWVAACAGAIVLVSAAASLDAAVSDDQFWRVGTAITSLWILAALLAFSVPLLDRTLTRSTVWLVPLALLAGIAAAGLLTLWAGEFAPQGYSIFFTLVIAVLAAAALLGGLLAVERRAFVIGGSAIAAAPPALAVAVYGIWTDPEHILWIYTGIVVVVALLVALPARLFARREGSTFLAAAAGVTAGAAAVVGIWDVWNENVELTLAPQAATALWIVAVLCSLLVPVLEHYRASTPGLQASEAGS